MRLCWPIPDSLQQQFGFSHRELCKMAKDFMVYSTDLRVNTYYETSDSDLAFMPANDDNARSYHVPIASVGSAIMDLEHESETPLSSDHVGCATFEGDDFARDLFVSELQEAVSVAAKLSRIKDCHIDLESEVKVEANGFFEDSTSTVKLWTARPSLAELLAEGPKKLLEVRLRQSLSSGKSLPPKVEIPSNRKQEAPAPAVTGSAVGPNSQRRDQTNDIVPKEVLQEERLAGEPPPLARSLSKGRVIQTSSQTQTEADKSAQPDASTATTARGPTGNVKFSLQGLPKLDRKGSVVQANPGPHLPAMDRLKLIWVHIPYTHAGWVSRVLHHVSENVEKEPQSDFLKDEHWASNHNHGRHAAPHARYVKSSFVDPDKGVRAQSYGNRSRFAVYVGSSLPTRLG